MAKKQFENKQYDPAQFGAQQFPGGGVQLMPPGTGCDDVYYANRSDIELIFGKSNVAAWADVDNNGVVDDITDRICWALAQSQAWINDSLKGGPYRVPFVLPYPLQIRLESARYAGCALYDSRGITDYDGDGKVQDSLQVQREKTSCFIHKILARQMRLVGITDVASTVPGIVSTEDE